MVGWQPENVQAVYVQGVTVDLTTFAALVRIDFKRVTCLKSQNERDSIPTTFALPPTKRASPSLLSLWKPSLAPQHAFRF